MKLFKRRGERPAKADRRAVWRTVAARTGGRFVEGKRPFKDRVVLAHGPWDLHLDTYVVSNGQTAVTYTRVRAYFLGWRELKVVVRRRNVLDRLLETLGFGSRLPLSRTFSDKYVAKGKPAPRLLSLFSGSRLAETIMAVPSLRLQVKRAGRKMRKKFGESAGVAVCQTTGVILDVERLVGMMEVVQEALEGVQRVGEANDDSPVRAE